MVKEEKQILLSYFILLAAIGPAVISNTFMMIWLQSLYKDDSTGLIKNKDDINFYYQYQGVSGCVLSFIFLYIFGKLADNLPAKIMVPTSFVLRGIFYSLMYLVESPDSLLFYTVTPLYHVTYNIVIISI